MQLFLIFLLLCTTVYPFVAAVSEHPILLVISFDAFRYDFFEKGACPHLKALGERSVRTSYMRNAFPTKTFPNHFSIATGLYAEHHGAIDNSFYDQRTDTVKYYGYELFHQNESVVPIWRLNEDAGHGRYSGNMMWPGANYLYQGKNVTHSINWQLGYDWKARVDTVMSWIEHPDKPANLVMMYIEEPDYDGHVYGPESQVVLNYLKKLDELALYIDQQLKMRQLSDKVNVIHLSDHGMSSVTLANIIDATRFLPPGSENHYKLAGSTPTMHLIPDAEHTDLYYRLLKNASIANGNFRVYLKSELPDRWHFKRNERVPPVFLLAEPGYGFQDLNKTIAEYVKEYNITVTEESRFGVHGYDNEIAAMRPFFMARGPRVFSNLTVEPFDNVDLYNLFCEILGLVPDFETDGSLDNVRAVLVQIDVPVFPVVVVVVAVALSILVVLTCVVVASLLVVKRRQSATTNEALGKRFPQALPFTRYEQQHLLTDDA